MRYVGRGANPRPLGTGRAAGSAGVSRRTERHDRRSARIRTSVRLRRAKLTEDGPARLRVLQAASPSPGSNADADPIHGANGRRADRSSLRRRSARSAGRLSKWRAMWNHTGAVPMPNWVPPSDNGPELAGNAGRRVPREVERPLSSTRIWLDRPTNSSVSACSSTASRAPACATPAHAHSRKSGTRASGPKLSDAWDGKFFLRAMRLGHIAENTVPGCFVRSAGRRTPLAGQSGPRTGIPRSPPLRAAGGGGAVAATDAAVVPNTRRAMRPMVSPLRRSEHHHAGQRQHDSRFGSGGRGQRQRDRDAPAQAGPGEQALPAPRGSSSSRPIRPSGWRRSPAREQMMVRDRPQQHP